MSDLGHENDTDQSKQCPFSLHGETLEWSLTLLQVDKLNFHPGLTNYNQLLIFRLHFMHNAVILPNMEHQKCLYLGYCWKDIDLNFTIMILVSTQT